MKVLMISTDQKMLEPTSEVRARMIDYAGLADHLSVLLVSKFKPASTLPTIASDRLTIYPVSYWRAWWWCVGEKFDLVTAQDPFENGLLGRHLAKKYQASLQLQVHTDLLSPYFGGESLKNKIRLMIARRLLPTADSIRVVSQRIKDSLKIRWNIAESKIVVLPIAVDVEALRQAPIKTNLKERLPQFGKIVLVASRLTKEKNIYLVIKAFAVVVKQWAGAGLAIVGAGPEEAHLKGLVKKLGLDGAVVFLGWSDDLSSCYKTADLFINTSDYEGFGRTIVEALACGCPVISTDVGIARDAGAVIVERQPAVLAAAISAVMTAGAKVTLSEKYVMSQSEYLALYKQSWIEAARTS